MIKFTNVSVCSGFKIKFVLFLFLFTVSFGSYGQVLSEQFNETTTSVITGGTGMPSAYSTGNYVLTSGTWAFANVIANTTATLNYSSPRGLQLRSSPIGSATSPTIATGGVGVLSFYAASTAAGGGINVSWSVNGGAFNTGTNFTSLTTSPVLKTLTINEAGSNIIIKFTRTAATVVLDDVSTTSYSIGATPILTTPTAAAIATTTATLGATITSNGGAAITSRGTVWGTAASPTGNLLAEGGTGISAFNHARTGFTANTLYYYRGYAVNANGTGYSPDGNFTTLHNAPNIGTSSGATSTSINVNWTAPTGGSAAFDYEIEVDDDPLFGSVNFTNQFLSTTLTATADGLNPSTTYYSRVRVVNAGGNSAWSSTSSGYSTLAPSPTIVLTPSILSGFNYILGAGPSANQTFTVGGTTLSSNITLTLTGNYEMSLSPTSGFGTSPIILTQTGGIVNTTVIYVRLKSGLSINPYSSTITATSTGASNKSVTCSGSVTLTATTSFSPGDFAVIAVNSNISCYPAGPNGAYSGGDDEISFMIFKDIQNGDTFYITDNGYERATAGLWGDTEGVTQLIRTGGTILAGTVITIRLRNTAPIMEFVSPDTNWSFAKEPGFTGSLVMNSGGDQLFFMQGGTWNNPAGTHDATYTPGNYLYGFNTNAAWNSLGGTTQQSALPMELTCFSLKPGSATDYLEYTGPVTSAAKLDWIARLNNPSNWTDRVNCAGFTRTHVGQVYTISSGGTFIDGVWTGTKSTDWFDCSNWQTLEVPDQSVDVNINSTFALRDAVIDVASPNASIYGSIAKSNNTSISSNTVQIQGNANNKLEVHGNLLINGSGNLDMDDSTAAADGQLYLYGNWTNSAGNNAFQEGDSTIHLTGSGTQIINPVTPEGTEIFKNLVFNNNFDTSISNNVIATGNVTINASKLVTVAANNYLQASNNLVNSGTLDILDKGSLIMLNDSGTVTNSGTTNIHRTTTPFEKYDYTYWSSPIVTPAIATTFSTWQTGYAFKFEPTNFVDLITMNNGVQTASIPDGFDDDENDWVNTTTMTPGLGYIIMGPTTGTFPKTESVTFTGTVNNGVIAPKIFLTPGIPSDDDWNLVGNPYPSAISANDFINANLPNISGTLYFWTHKADLGGCENFGPDILNFSQDDYAMYNLTGGTATGATVGTGSVSGGSVPTGYIASGQGFFVEAQVNDVSLTFNNSMRSRVHSNTQFFKVAPKKGKSNVKDRLWLNLENSLGMFSQQLVGYFSEATLGYDTGYDGLFNDGGNYVNFYSFIDNDTYKIQGRSIFEENDQVRLGYFSSVSGTFKINIDSKEGIFTKVDTEIYLEDKLLNVVHNIKESPYSFTTDKGTFNDRFVLRYTNKSIVNASSTALEDKVLVSHKDKRIQIDSPEIMDNVYIYDELGRKIYQKTNVNNNQLLINNLIPTRQILVVKIEQLDGQVKTKKIMF